MANAIRLSFASAAIAATISAELPPAVYKELQDRAPEYLVIRVLSVESRQSDEQESVRFDVTAEARIQEVTRSASGLKAGAVIRISYVTKRHKQPAWVGPSPVPMLVEGWVGPAFLAKSKERSTYAPAAGGQSFRVMK